MRLNPAFLRVAFLMTLILSACAPIPDTDLPLPESAANVVGSIPPPAGGNTPTNGGGGGGCAPPSGGEATPAPGNIPIIGGSDAITMLAYGLLALAGAVRHITQAGY